MPLNKFYKRKLKKFIKVIICDNLSRGLFVNLINEKLTILNNSGRKEGVNYGIGR